MLRPFFKLTGGGRLGSGLSTLLFHKLPSVSDPITPSETRAEQFIRVLDFVEQHFNVLPLGEAVKRLKNGKLPTRALAITFDDGYRNWLTVAAPALKARNLHATFFITTGQINGKSMWNERIVSAVRALPEIGASLPAHLKFTDRLSSDLERARLCKQLTEYLKYVSVSEREATIQILESQSTVASHDVEHFDADAVNSIHSMGFGIGAHTINHPILNTCSDTEALHEIAGSKEVLEEIISARVQHFAFPNGKPIQDFGEQHIAMVKKCGFDASFTTGHGVAMPGDDLFQIPRFSPWGQSANAMAWQLWRNSCAQPVFIVGHKTPEDVRCLLVASVFPPIHGGSAVVYANICRHLPVGTIRVLTAKKNHAFNSAIKDWHAHDCGLTYPVDRVDLLRPVSLPPPRNRVVSLFRFIWNDLPLYVKIIYAINNIVRTQRINIICIGELISGGWIGIISKRIFGCRVLIYVHGEEVTTQTSGKLSSLREKCLQEADRVISVSRFTSARLKSDMKLNGQAIELIENGVDTEKFFPADESAINATRLALGLKSNKVLLSVGRLVPRKGFDTAILAQLEIIKVIPNSVLLIIGDGPYKPMLQRMIDDLGLGEHVQLLGSVSDVDLLKYMQSCDLFIMPNRTMPDGDTEGFGLVFREANACGKPVIGGRAGGVVEAVHDGKSGFLVDGDVPSDVSTAAIRLLSDSVLYEEMSRYGLNLARECNTDKMAKQFYSLCSSVLSTRQ